jgi:hypothetical protein
MNKVQISESESSATSTLTAMAAHTINGILKPMPKMGTE